uniref:Ig-like domain-containing protein n=1 Tax=Heligmosomoides polygyrus TaxID=6339 RepID=A0A183GAD1_HELPZ
LELVALQIGAPLTKFIHEELDPPITKVKFYSDSRLTLHWIHSEKTKGVFVQNRYITSNENPADCATRGLAREELLNHMWCNDATFLTKEESTWILTCDFDIPQSAPDQAIAVHATRTKIDSPALPHSRTTSSRVFENVGVDVAGPFYVNEIINTSKNWVCLFT